MTTHVPALMALCLLASLAGCQRQAPPATVPDSKADTRHGESAESHDVTLTEDVQRASGITFATAAAKSMTGIIQATGVVTANESRVAHIRPLARGRILKVSVRSGDRVKKGQVLLTYDNIELGESVGDYLRAIGALQRARTELDLARRSLERATNLLGSGAIARAEADRRQAEFHNTETAVQAQQAEEARIHEKLHRFGLEETDIRGLIKANGADFHREVSISTLRAPFDGAILKAVAAEGETVSAEQELFTLIDTTTVWILADVYERDIASIREGATAAVTIDSFAGETLTGRVTNVSDSLDPSSRTAKVRVEVANLARRLKLEMFANIAIPTTQSRSALVIPASALQQIGGKPVVFVRESPTKFEAREVETGTQWPNWTEIIKGVSANDVVVAKGAFLLKSELAKSELAHEH